MIDKCPCKDCPFRCVGCHSSCPKYISWRQELDIIGEKRKDYAEANYVEDRRVLRKRKYKGRKN